ncbi:hypothetical protein [Cohnella sp. GbtcB17]|uniref:portal protein n=1 Tax=Cohnella sp. GbtcB17 TaxID=2824762 RepID=UPI001C2FAD03|nr:hypothetical protein [Cohnella sp. GbtcB17]
MRLPFGKKASAPDKPAPTEDKRLTPSKLDDLFKSAENWTDIRQILVNMNYFVGNQWIGWNRAERRIQSLPIPDGVERITLNKIRPRVMTLLAKHIKNKLKYDVMPASKEQRDIDAAKAADKYLQSMWQELDFSGKTRDIFLNMLIKKRCWVKTWFDASAGDDITPEEGDHGYEAWAAGPRQRIFTGKIRARVCDPLTIFWDQAATTEEEIRWIIERKARDVDEIFEEYGVHVEADANLGFLNNFDVSQIGADGTLNGQLVRNRNMALVYELWWRPCKKYPNGAKLTVCNGQVLDYDENSGELPYVLFGYQPIPGTLQYDAIITDMLPVQRGINTKRTMIATHAKRLGNGMWLNPQGSGADEEELVNEIGGIINYTPINGAKPERVSAPDIPSFYDRDLANDAIDMDDMSGAREVSQGRMPAGLDTLGGLEIMVEQENEKLTVASQNYENGMKRVLQRILRLLKAHYTEERQGRIVGEDNEIEVIAFNGSDLNGAEDIKIVQGSSLPEMKAAQQERILLMWDKGAIVKRDGTPDTQALLRLMGMGDSTELFEETALDENNAKMENKQFEDMQQDPQLLAVIEQYAAQYQSALQQLRQAGVPPEQWTAALPKPPPGTPEVWDSDDNEVHLYLHNLFRKTSRYRQMPPPLRMLVDIHYQEHLERLQAPAMAQQQQEAAVAQQQQEAQAAEAAAGREHQTAMKQADLAAKAQSDQLKAAAMLTASAARGNATGT